MNAFAKVDRETFRRFAAEHPEQRYELERGRIVQQMTGGTRRHGIVARRIAQLIEDQIDSSRWTVLTDRGVGIGTSSRNADVVVEPGSESLDSLETEHPALIVEVLSPTTSGTDLNTKPGEYLRLSTLDAYLVEMLIRYEHDALESPSPNLTAWCEQLAQTAPRPEVAR